MSGAVDTRKWNAKWRNRNISDIIFSLSSIEGRKQWKRQKYLRSVLGQCHLREHGRIWFSRFKEEHFDIRDTPRSGKPSGFDEDRLNTLIQWSTSVYSRTGKCDELRPFHHRAIFASMAKSGVWVPHALSQNHKNQRVVIICTSLVARHRFAREQHRPFLSWIFTGDEKWCLYANIRKREEWLNQNKRKLCRKCSKLSTLHSIF